MGVIRFASGGVLLRRYAQSADTEPAENAKGFASGCHQLTSVTEQFGAAESDSAENSFFNHVAIETYNRSRARSVCNGDAQGPSRFSCVAA